MDGRAEPELAQEERKPVDPSCSRPNTETAKVSHPMKYAITDNPPLHITVLYGLQLVFANMDGPLIIVAVIRSQICGSHDNLLFAELLSTSIFMMGICTFLQVTFGVRLPALQGSNPAYLAPIAAVMATGQWKCPPLCSGLNETDLLPNTTSPGEEMPCDDEAWRSRLLAISGGLIAASIVHCGLGLTGVVGFLQNFIGPLTVAPTMALIGLTVVPIVAESCSPHWGIACFTMAVYILLALIVSRYPIPCCTWSRDKGCTFPRVPLFQLFPVLIAIIVGWLTCFILTECGAFTSDPSRPAYRARADARIDTIHKSKWFFFPYPGYWGTPTFSVAIFVGIIAAVIQSVLESMGDYYTMAAMCQVPVPPKHAVNRGIAVEGFASLLSGLLGACHATTTYSTVLGIIAITRVCSRVVFQAAAVILVLCGVFGKFGAALSMCPDPVIGAISVMSLGLVTSAGLSTLRHCDMTSTRNMVVLGTSLMLGVTVPNYMQNNPDAIDTGNSTADHVFTVLLSSGMLVGSILGFLLDNIVPGTKEERGLTSFLRDLSKGPDSAEETEGGEESTTHTDLYDFPWDISRCLRRLPCTTYIPFLPQYDDTCPCLQSCRRSRLRKRERSSAETSNGIELNNSSQTRYGAEETSARV